MERNKSIFYSLLNAYTIHAEENTPPIYQDGNSQRKVLVGGGTGFIGQTLCADLKRKG